MSSKCQLNEPPFFQCCCKCIHHLPDYYHCSVSGKKGADCVCGNKKGWVCKPLGHDGRVFSGWPKHSCGCEMYTTQEVHDKRQKPIDKIMDRYYKRQDVKMWVGIIFKRIFERDFKNMVFAVKKLWNCLK